MPVIEGGQVLLGGQDFGGVLGGQVLYGGQEIEPEQGGRTQPDSEAVEMSVGPFRRSGAPPNGWYNGVADKGATAVDITTGIQYTNTGTKAATVWTAASGGGSGPVWSTPVPITDDQVLALDTAHVDIVPAPDDPNVLLLPLLVFIKQDGTLDGYSEQPITTRLTIGWGGVSANEPGAGIVVSQPVASVLSAAQRHIIIPVGTGFGGATGQVGAVAAAVNVGPGLAISFGADDVMAGTADPTRSLLVWTLYQRITLPS